VCKKPVYVCTVTVNVNLSSNTAAAARVFTVGIAPNSTRIRGAATVTITQAFLDASKVTLAAGSAVNAAHDAITAAVTFTGAGTLTNTDLAATDFAVTGGASIATATVAAGTVTVNVTLTANTTAANRTFVVSISPMASKIQGSATVTITQSAPPVIDTRVELAAGTGYSPAHDATSAQVTFTGAGALTTADLAAADFTLTPTTVGVSISNVVVVAGTVTVTVTLTANIGTTDRTFVVGIADNSEKIKGDAKVNIVQGYPGDTRPELAAGTGASVDADETSAQVTFTGAGSITSLLTTEFTVNLPATISGVAVAAGTVTVTVNFPANTNPASTVTYTVGIATGGANIKGTDTVIIEQAVYIPRPSYFYPVFRKVTFEDIALGNFTGGTLWTTLNGTIGAGANTTAISQQVVANPNSNGNSSARVLRVHVANQGGVRGQQFNFTKATDDVESSYTRHKIKFDWRPSTIGIQDGTVFTGSGNLDNQFIALYVGADGSFKYRVGNTPAGDVDNGTTDGILNIPPGIDTGITTSLDMWYQVVVIIDTEEKNINLTISDLAEDKVVFSVTVPFAAGINYQPRIASMRFFRVRAPAQDGPWTTYVDNIELFRGTYFDGPIANLPAVVTGLVCTGVSDRQASFSWTAANFAEGYKFFYAEKGQAYPDTPHYTVVGTTTYTLTGLTNGTAYTAKVVATNSAGDASPSNEVEFTPMATPEAVVNLLCPDATNGSAVLIWPAAARAASYKVFYHKAGESYPATPQETVIGNTNVVLTGLENGVVYFAKVVASNTYGDAADSDEVEFSPVALGYTRSFLKKHFEEDAIGDFSGATAQGTINQVIYWTTRIGLSGTPNGAMDQMIQGNPAKIGNTSDRVLMLRNNRAGGSRASQLNFTTATDMAAGATSSRHGIAFDWYPGVPEFNNGYLGIQDGTTAAFNNSGFNLDNQFIAFYVTPVIQLGDDDQEESTLKYRVGNPPDGQDVVSGDSQEGLISTGITTNMNKWYHVRVIIDTDAKTIDVLIIDIEEDESVFEQVGIPFAGGIEYNPRIASMRFLGQRSANNNAQALWATYIDNLELFRY
jgi:hypothetical protein